MHSMFLLPIQQLLSSRLHFLEPWMSSTKGELYFPINTQITDTASNTTYQLLKMIGRGAYAQCFLVSANQSHYALKIVRLSDLKNKKTRQKLQTEIEIQSSLDHPNVVRMFSSFRNAEYVFMVLELCERGALDELLKRNGRLKERYVSKFVMQLALGLKYLHEEKSIVHRDIKLGNIFLDRHLNIKIGDFGLSAVISGDEKRKTVCGTPNFIAPEVLTGSISGHSFEADIWSLGVTIYTLLVGKPPFHRKKPEEIYKLIEKNVYNFPEGNTLSSDAINLITGLLTTRPEDRLTLDEVLKHRFITHRENLAYRIYKSISSNGFIIEEPKCDYTLFSMPISSIGGIGYVLKSGVCGIYYQDMVNTYLKENAFVQVKINGIDGGRKVFVTEEHHIEKIPSSLSERYTNILLFVKKYSRMWQHHKVEPKNEESTAFVAKIKKINDGLLFVMTNNVFVFDFNNGARVAVSRDGKAVYSFDDEGEIKLTKELKQACVEVLKPYCANR